MRGGARPQSYKSLLDHLNGEPEGLVIAFHDEALEKGGGTSDCIAKARRRPGTPALF